MTTICLINDLPFYAADVAHGWVNQLVEGMGQEVEIVHGTSLTPVGQCNIDSLAPI